MGRVEASAGQPEHGRQTADIGVEYHKLTRLFEVAYLAGEGLTAN
jgi:hypothetical protein